MPENTDTTLLLMLTFDGEDDGEKPDVLLELTQILDKMKNEKRIISWEVIP